MAQNRLVSTSFWKDTYVTDLDPTEKLLFLYLLTNPLTNIAGIYEISLREMAFDTGIDKEMIAKIIERFQKDGKVYYSKGWITLINWLNHQALNPKMVTGAQALMQNVPIWYRHELLAIGKPIDSLSEPMDKLPVIIFNVMLFNLIKFNSIAAEPQDFNKRTYAQAAQADREQVARTVAARSRKGSHAEALGSTLSYDPVLDEPPVAEGN